MTITKAPDSIFDPSTDTETLDPLAIFERWLSGARKQAGFLATAMSLATVNNNGAPDVRMVLLQAVSSGRLIFFTNLDSTKGQHLKINNNAAVCFHWPSCGQQVRVRGSVGRVANGYADAYFASRPRGAQIGAHISAQSSVIPGRAALLERIREFEEQSGGGLIPRPEHWSGLHLTPDEIEFWEDGTDRLHDRLLFTRKAEENVWASQRLSP